MAKSIKNSPKILGLDVSTKTIGVALFDLSSRDLLELTHISPRPKPTSDNKMEELINKSTLFRKKLEEYKGIGVIRVVIEEPLLNSNNVYTIATLLRYNTLISKEVFDVLGVVPEYVSTYNSRKLAFPELVQKNEKGKHVLFGGYPKDVDKKMIIWELVSKREPQIQWLYTRNNTLKKENFDMTDAYTVVLSYLNLKN
jgi:RNase H-fold protein (predicted Holliday junction resolvase)